MGMGMGVGIVAKGSKGEQERLEEAEVEAEMELKEGGMEDGATDFVRRLLGALDFGAGGGNVIEDAGAGGGAGAGAAAGLGLLSFRRDVARFGSIVGD